MLDANTVLLTRALVSATKTDRDEFWKSLEEYCEKNGMGVGFYCPYIPLQMVPASNIVMPIAFKTRYGLIDKKEE